MSDCNDILKFLDEHWPKINKNPTELKAYFQHKRQNAENEAQNDLEKSISHLLSDIHDESLDDQSRSREMTVARTMARFSSLQIKLSQAADKTADKNIKIQGNLIRLTYIILGLTAAMFFLQCFQVASSFYEDRPKIDKGAQIEYSKKYSQDGLYIIEEFHSKTSSGLKNEAQQGATANP